MLFTHRGRRYGVEFKFREAPAETRLMHIALADLELEHLGVVYPGKHRFPMAERLTAWPLREVQLLTAELQ